MSSSERAFLIYHESRLILLQCRTRKQRCMSLEDASPAHLQAPCRRCKHSSTTCSFETEQLPQIDASTSRSELAQIVVDLQQRYVFRSVTPQQPALIYQDSISMSAGSKSLSDLQSSSRDKKREGAIPILSQASLMKHPAMAGTARQESLRPP